MTTTTEINELWGDAWGTEREKEVFSMNWFSQDELEQLRRDLKIKLSVWFIKKDKCEMFDLIDSVFAKYIKED